MVHITEIIKLKYSYDESTTALTYKPQENKRDDWNQRFAGEPVKGFLVGGDLYELVGSLSYLIRDIKGVLSGELTDIKGYKTEDLREEAHKYDKYQKQRARQLKGKYKAQILNEIREHMTTRKEVKKANPRYYADLYFKQGRWQVKIWNKDSFILGGFFHDKQEAAKEAQELRKAFNLPYFTSPNEIANKEDYLTQRKAELDDLERVDLTEVERNVINLRMKHNFLYREFG